MECLADSLSRPLEETTFALSRDLSDRAEVRPMETLRLRSAILRSVIGMNACITISYTHGTISCNLVVINISQGSNFRDYVLMSLFPSRITVRNYLTGEFLKIK